MKSLLIALSLFLFVHVGASAANDAGIYASLIAGFGQEVQEFDQTHENAATVSEFKKDWEAYVLNSQALPAKWKQNYSWSKYLASMNPQNFYPRTATSSAPEVALLPAPPKLLGEHSILDSKKYASERIGDDITQILQSNKVKVLLYAGDVESFSLANGIDPSALKSVPSPYSSWGIYKYLVSGSAFPDAEPRFVMVLPPSKEYLIHYQNIFRQLGIQVEKAMLNLTDQRNQDRRLLTAFNKIRARDQGRVDVVALGYYNDMKQNLKSVLPEIEISVGAGLTLFLGDDLSTKPATRYLLIKSDLTIWGESSAALIKAALSLSPKAVLFMGSAGGITPMTSVYDISVPSEFYLRGKKLPINNEVFKNLSHYRAPLENGIALGMRHGHTNSPMEQTKNFVSGHIQAGVGSIDVEQNLIAETIVQHNANNIEQVLFGAINLITDKPRSLHHQGEAEHDLSKIDHSRKSGARIQAVKTAFAGFRNSRSMNKIKISCDKYFQEAN